MVQYFYKDSRNMEKRLRQVRHAKLPSYNAVDKFRILCFFYDKQHIFEFCTT